MVALVLLLLCGFVVLLFVGAALGGLIKGVLDQRKEGRSRHSSIEKNAQKMKDQDWETVKTMAKNRRSA